MWTLTFIFKKSISSNVETAEHNMSVDIFKWTKKSNCVSYMGKLLWGHLTYQKGLLSLLSLFSYAKQSARAGST